MIDSHCHLQDPKFDSDRDAVVRRARVAGVSPLVVIGYDIDSSRLAVELAESMHDVYATVGVHPHDAKTVAARDIDALARLAESPRVVAIGEIGLDFYRNLSPQEAQRRAFREQLALARSLGLPVVIHARDADEETSDMLADYARAAESPSPAGKPLGVMHCFAGDLPLALRYVELGFLISIAGTCTYPNAERTRAVARGIPLRSLVVETDAPYLPPQSQRGSRNEPAYLVETVDFVANLRGETAHEVADATAGAASRLFGLANAAEPAVEAAGGRR